MTAWLHVVGASGACAAAAVWLVRDTGLRRRPALWLSLAASLGSLVFTALVSLHIAGESYFRFARHWTLWLGFGAMVLVTWRLTRHHRRQHRFRETLSDVLVGLIVLCATGAASDVEIGRPLDRLAVVLAIDNSRSIELVPNSKQRLRTERLVVEASMREEDLIATVVFGADAVILDPLRPKRQAPSAQQASVARDGTDIAAGLRLALAELPTDASPRVVLISDGVVTRGDAMSAATAAMAADVPIDVLPLEQRTLPDVRIVSLHAPSRAREGETMPMRLVVASPRATKIEVRVYRDGKLIRRAHTQVRQGEDVLRIDEVAKRGGLHRYDVKISAVDPSLDAVAEDNEASAFVRVKGPARALVLDGDPGKTNFIASALQQAGFETRQGGTPSVPTDIAAMATYDLIVMGDIPAASLDPQQIHDLASYVRDIGGGLLLIGGDRSMGPGGYALTPLESISPVSFDLKQDKRRASLAEVIAIDISGSMGMRVGGHTKLQLANEGAARSAQLLGTGDQLGVLHVDTAPIWSVALAPVKDKKAIVTAIRGVSPGGGGIYVDVALQEAYRALEKKSVNLKHVLLFADGADAEKISPAVEAMVDTAARQKRITTSCVALGQGPDTGKLETLSRLGGGRFYIVEDARRLPAVFTQETIAATRSAIVEESFRVTQSGSGSAIAGVDFGAAPPLEGYVVTIPKGRSDVLLRGPENDPILALWSVGVGRAAVFTSDLKTWGAAWTHWSDASRLIAQTARAVSRSGDDSLVNLKSEIVGGQLFLRANVLDENGEGESFRRLLTTVRGPGGFSREVALEPAGGGSYIATLPLTRPGAYLAVARDSGSNRAVATSGAVLSKGEELRPNGSDLAMLDRLSALTGGKRRDTLAGLFHDRGKRRFAYDSVSWLLVLIAAAAMLLMVAARRLAIPTAAYDWLERLRGQARESAQIQDEKEAERRHAAQQTLDKLLSNTSRPSHQASSANVEPQAAPITPLPRVRLSPPSPAAAPSPPPQQKDAPAMSLPPSSRRAAGRPLTAVEILLQRRRKKRRL